MSRAPDAEGEAEACRELLVAGQVDTEGLLERMARCLGRDMQRHAMRRCGNGPDAEDAVQDAMATAMRYLEGFRGETSLRSWLLRLISTACIHQRRGRRNDPSLHSSLDVAEGPASTLFSPEPLAEESLMVSERLGRVAVLLSSLSEEDRLLLLRHEGEEVPLAELAAELGQTVAAVRSRLFRVRQRLRDQLGEALHDEEDSAP